MGHTVTIFAASTVHNSTINLITDRSAWREETVDGIHYVYVRCRDYQGNGLKRIYNMLEFARKLPSVCKNFTKPDAIIATSMTLQAATVGIRLAKKYGCKVIAEISDLWPESIVAYGIAGANNPAVRYLRKVEKRLYMNADAVIFTMEGAYDYIVEQGWEKEIPRSKVHCINNGVDLEAFQYNRTHCQVEDPDLQNSDIFKVVYTGSIRRVNNLGLLLDAAKLVTDPRVRFLIWGDGDERPILEQRVRDEGISNVVFKGKVEKTYVPYIVSQADLNIAHNTPMTLFRFGISFNKLFDYLAAERPVLCDFPCPYNPAIQCGAGISVDDPTSKNIAVAIEQMSRLPAGTYELYCKAAKATAEVYDFKNLTKKLVEVIERLR